MARLYSNENFPLPVVLELREFGHDVLTIQEAGNAERSMSDERVLKFSCDERRTLLTINRKHFIRLHRERPEHYGIVACTFDADFSRQAIRIKLMMQSH